MVSIKVDYHASAPDDIPMSMTVTMSVSNWRRLRAGLVEHGAYPGWKIANEIANMLEQAERHFLLESPIVVDES